MVKIAWSGLRLVATIHQKGSRKVIPTTSNASGAITQSVNIPAGAANGVGTLDATGATPGDGASASFMVSGSPITFVLTVSKTGTGTGAVSSSPAGVTCGATCQASFGTGTPVTLTATPDVSSTFTGWSGSGCSGTGTCQVTMSAAHSVTATFTLKTFALTASKTNLSWWAEIFVHCRSIGSAGTLFCTGIAHFNVGLIASTLQPIMLPDSAAAVSGAVDLTAANIISVQYLRSGSTAETMTVHDIEVEALN
jgi:hypothetical protein